eukprot:scaffold33304_cov129-Isochrysis_galbana.AAC.5
MELRCPVEPPLACRAAVAVAPVTCKLLAPHPQDPSAMRASHSNSTTHKVPSAGALPLIAWRSGGCASYLRLWPKAVGTYRDPGLWQPVHVYDYGAVGRTMRCATR